MSEENVRLHGLAIRAVNERDLAGMLALMGEDVEISAQTTAMEGRYSGHKGVRDWWDDLLGTFPDWTLELNEIRDLGDVTIASFEACGHAATSGMPVSTFIWQVGRWRDSRCTSWATFRSEAEALEAVGLAE
jgi:ketosteroid isomerase-like protein